MIVSFSISVVVAFLLRVLLSFLPGFQADILTWYAWADRLVNLGFAKFYDPKIWTHYTPGYLYIWRILGIIKKTFHLSGEGFLLQLFKFPNNLADILTAILIYKILLKKSSRWALLGLIFHLFNPALIFNSSVWGQLDSLLIFLLLTSFYLLLEKRMIFLSSLVFAFAFLVKPQALFILPIMTVLLIKKHRLNETFKYFSGCLLTSLLLALPFFPHDPIFGLPKLILQMSKDYPYTTLNAFNFWRLFGNWQKDDVLFLGWSKFYWGFFIYLFFEVIIVFYLLFKKRVKKETYYLAASLSLFNFFFFPTRIHERYLLPSLPFLLITAVSLQSKFLITNFLLLSTLHFINLAYIYNSFYPEFIQVLSFLNINRLPLVLSSLTFIILCLLLYFYSQGFKVSNSTLKNLCSFLRQKRIFFPQKSIFKKTAIEQKLLFLILAFSFLIRICNLHHPQTHIFDEAYHAFTAQEMYKGNLAAWEWWNTPPKGFAYEWTHPPMAKLLMMAGIALFGSNSFGWRIPGAVFGTGVVFLIYLLGKELFNKKIALLATFLAAFEGLLFVMSRIGMSDIYFLFFSLTAILAKLKKKTFLSAVLFGFSLATKWTAFYLFPLLLFLNLLQKKLSKKTALKIILDSCLYLVIAAAVYLLSYLPFLSTHPFEKFILLQKQMWWYHTRLEATHDYQSKAYSWPLMLRPVWFYVKYEKEKIANIYTLGNPLILWGGLVILPYTLVTALLKKQKKLLFTLLAYFIFWVPWVFSPRIMFFYHYLPSIPFLCLILAWNLEKGLKTKKKINWLMKIYLILIIVTFLFFYPHLTGLLVPKNLDHFYYWLPSWK